MFLTRSRKLQEAFHWLLSVLGRQGAQISAATRQRRTASLTLYCLYPAIVCQRQMATVVAG